MSIVAKPLKLPPVPAERVRLYNALSLVGLSAGAEVKAAGLRVRLTGAPPQFEKAAVMSVLVNGQPWQIELSNLDLIAGCGVLADPDLADIRLEDLPEELQAAVAESLAEPLLDAVSAALGMPVQFTGFELAQPGKAGGRAVAGFEVRGADASGAERTVFVRAVPASFELASRLADMLGAFPVRRGGFLSAAAEAIPLQLAVSGGITDLKLSEYRALMPGDVIIADAWLPASGKAAVTVKSAGQARYGWMATLKDGEATLDAPDSENTTQEKTTMQNSDDMEVRLTFELESRTITVADLKSLQPGYTFRLTSDPGAPVTVLANGKPVAQGRLVDINGTIGVELMQASGI